MDYTKYLDFCNRLPPFITLNELKGLEIKLIKEPECITREHAKNNVGQLTLDVEGIGVRRLDLSRAQFQQFIIFASEQKIEVNTPFILVDIKERKINKRCFEYILTFSTFIKKTPKVDISKLPEVIEEDKETAIQIMEIKQSIEDANIKWGRIITVGEKRKALNIEDYEKGLNYFNQLINETQLDRSIIKRLWDIFINLAYKIKIKTPEGSKELERELIKTFKGIEKKN